MAIFWCIATALLADSAGGQAKDEPIPPFLEVQKAVWRHFQKQPDFQPGDVIARNEVEPLLAQLQRMGLPLPDAKQMLEKVPVEDEFLVEQLRTPKGRQFMRRIASDPGAYDRLDRLSRMPHGQQTIRDLIKGPGGERLIDYMTQTSGGKVLGDQLSNAPTGKNFNDPTGRVYTVEMLLTQLEQSRAAAVKARVETPFPTAGK